MSIFVNIDVIYYEKWELREEGARLTGAEKTRRIFSFGVARATLLLFTIT